MKNKLPPIFWISTLYFAEGIPYFIVNTISVIMFKRFGMDNASIGVYTSFLYLPWVIKPFWAPFVDILKTKRWWIVATQLAMSVAFALLAFTTPENGADNSAFVPCLVIFWITGFMSATHDIAADGYYMLGLTAEDQTLYVGFRNTFYRIASVFGQGVIVVIAGLLDNRLHSPHHAWSITLVITCLIMSLLSFYHMHMLPRPSLDVGRCDTSARNIFRGVWKSLKTFFMKKGVWLAIAFMLLYRLPEALLVKMLNPFLMDQPSQGGLGLAETEVGLIYGTIGVVALLLGGILGGMAASRWGLKKMLWPMAMSLALPCFVFVVLSMFQPSSLWTIGACVTLDQFGYGFGFTAYMLYMLYFSEGEFKTSHYSFCTAFMALSMMLPGFFAGYLQHWLGYQGFFWMVMVCCLATVGAALMVKVEPNYGKKS